MEMKHSSSYAVHLSTYNKWLSNRQKAWEPKELSKKEKHILGILNAKSKLPLCVKQLCLLLNQIEMPECVLDILENVCESIVNVLGNTMML